MKLRRTIVIATLAATAIAIAGLGMLARHWPFTREHVTKSLQDTFHGAVAMQSFRQTYFPHPGCVVETVTLRRDAGANAPLFATVRKLTIEGSYSGLLTKRLERIRLDGLYIRVPRGGAKFLGGQKSRLTIGEVVADGSVLEFGPKEPGPKEPGPKEPGKDPLKFEIRRLKFKWAGAGQVIPFETTLLIPKPPGELRATGKFGPWRSGDWKHTPVSGSYTFQHANLGVFHGIKGTLTSDGKFNGPLERIDVRDRTDLPDFEVTRSGHAVHLETQFQAIVNGTNGDVSLSRVDSHFERTTVISQGGVAGTPGEQGKTVRLDMMVREGRIQDLLRMFVKSNRPPMTGVIALQAKVTVSPEHRRFIEKVRMQGEFGIGAARFTKPNTQENVDKLSERARGDTHDDEDPESVVSNLHGHAALKDGVATFSNLSFSVPGALARIDGTYSLLTERIDFHGTLQMDAKLSEATKGVKSFLLKAVDPFFKNKKKGGGSIIAIKVSGTYSHPSFAVVPTGKK